jgi:hypothetical protein
MEKNMQNQNSNEVELQLNMRATARLSKQLADEIREEDPTDEEIEAALKENECTSHRD